MLIMGIVNKGRSSHDCFGSVAEFRGSSMISPRNGFTQTGLF